jgi:hypothetical protein
VKKRRQAADKQESSFCEQKEVKKLFPPLYRRRDSRTGTRRDQMDKSFLLLFSKKDTCLTV